MREHLEFFRQLRGRTKSIGAITPSSRFLAGAITEPYRRRKRPARILEVGPGTGAVTRKIVERLTPDDRFDLVELNESFAELLQRRFRVDPVFRRAAAHSSLHVGPLETFEPSGTYDYIISGLPLNNFSPSQVEDVFGTFFRLLGPRGVLSYFEYMYLRPIGKFVGRRRERSRMQALDRIVTPYLHRHRFRQSWVFVNVPPAWVQHLQNDSEIVVGQL